ncbi:hypothetical protein RchiOBHm_Chr3g0475751 [Rosa chinensis]|uniref:Late embryogenesis abundant protein, LEA-14 n=1 Tax=Rosa chinensis TaxID=74649 RepID=A0A2P6RCG5_ROSCH|nr:uncharacterized protein LOC112194288 [Rosa chinensis]PRQ44123.1 hypothetical protein RchiOBHm_Chr3g0475751 [Rosa chinensis]
MATSWCKDSPILNKVRGCILLVVIVVTLATAIGFTLWFIGSYVDSKSGPQTQPLVLRLDAFCLSNFEVSNSSLSAGWDAKMTFGNQNNGLTVTLYPFESFVYYKEGEDALSCALVDAMHIPPRKQKTVQIKFDSTGCGGDQPFIEDRVLKELSEDRKSGYLNFSMKMHIDASYSMRELLGMGTQVSLNPNCTNLKVEFVAAKGEGKIFGGRKCSVPLPN